MLSVIVLNVIMLSVVILNVAKLGASLTTKKASLKRRNQDPILNRVNVKTSFERQKKNRHKFLNVDNDDDDGGDGSNWKFKHFDVANWGKGRKVKLTDDDKEYFRQ
jgi:hypothetical protein